MIIEKLRGWRTLAFNAVAAALPVLELTEVRNVLPDHWLPWYALGIALANMYLRSITKTPVGKGSR